MKTKNIDSLKPFTLTIPYQGRDHVFTITLTAMLWLASYTLLECIHRVVSIITTVIAINDLLVSYIYYDVCICVRFKLI